MSWDAAARPGYVLAVYAAFALVAAVVGLAADRRAGADNLGDAVPTRRKLPTYVALNLAVLAALWAPAAWHLVPTLLAALAAVLAGELAAALGLARRARLAHALAAGGLVALAGAVPSAATLAPAWLALAVVGVAATSLSARAEVLGRRLLALAGALAYVPGCLAAWFGLWAGGPTGARAVFVYLAVAAHDAFAQVVGRAIGRTPLGPRLSPAKTVEGAVGGLVAAAGMGALLSVTAGWQPGAGAALGLACGVAAAAGDLTASAWKRALGLRTFGTVLGAHGGALDRFDGLLAAAAVLYLLAR